jgi:hypothetical protein
MMRCVLASFAVLLSAGPPGLQAQDKPLTEKQKIEALIKGIEDSKDTKFVRNDREYDAKTAAKFLRGKWESQEAEIKTARDFIEKVASISSTSGKPYRMRFKDGKEMKSGDYLSEELQKLDKVPTRKCRP